MLRKGSGEYYEGVEIDKIVYRVEFYTICLAGIVVEDCSQGVHSV
jgi:hypothetical protein